ncbi:MAG: pyridoxine 5'-phosphate synthase [Candidatus Puniceispirillaceae bacterium]
MEYLRLGVNIDHVATVRNARGGIHPSPVAAALLAQKAGGDGITAHLREDRRHIRDDDIAALKDAIDIPLNFEMAATEEMVAIALKLLPNAACIVPERREELTTEGGLAVAGQQARLSPLIQQLKGAGIRVSLFVDADEAELNAAAELGADIVELHTGRYCDSPAGSPRNQELERIAKGAQIAASAGLEVHAGHGLSFETVQEIAALPEIVELNIGHFLIGAAIYTGLEDVILQMRQLMNQARAAV